MSDDASAEFRKTLAAKLREAAADPKPEAEVMVVEFLTNLSQPIKVAVERNRLGDHEIALSVYGGEAAAVVRMDCESAETLVQSLELVVAGLMREEVQKVDD